MCTLRLSRFRIPFLAAIISVIACQASGCFSGSARMAAEGVCVTATVHAQFLTEVSRRAGWTDDEIASFPQLRIYDTLGRLIYIGHDGYASAQVVSGLPEDVKARSPIIGAASLDSVMEAFPEFHQQRMTITNHSGYTVISVLLDGCHGCTIQEGALDSTRPQLLKRGVNLLTVQVLHP